MIGRIWAFSLAVAALELGARADNPCPPADRTCLWDFDDGSGTGTPDDGITIDDLLYFLVLYADGASCADLDDGTFRSVPDGGVTIEDLLFFLEPELHEC